MSMRSFRVPLSALSWGPWHTSWLSFEKKAFWDILVKICEVIKGKVNCKPLFCFNYVQVLGNMELLIKAFRELMMTAVVKLVGSPSREAGYTAFCLGPLLQSPRSRGLLSKGWQAASDPDAQHPSHAGSDCSLNFASDPACWGLRRLAFTSGPDEIELQKNHSRGHSDLGP